MMLNFLYRLDINDDVDAEFVYWKDSFLTAVWSAAGFAIAAGVAILLWPEEFGNMTLRTFVRDVWPLFVECAFWLGFLAGLLFAAARRIGAGLAGTLPWQPDSQFRASVVAARRHGQVACGLALCSVVLWLAWLLVPVVSLAPTTMTAFLAVMSQACFGAATVLALAAIAARRRDRKG